MDTHQLSHRNAAVSPVLSRLRERPETLPRPSLSNPTILACNMHFLMTRIVYVNGEMVNNQRNILYDLTKVNDNL